MALQSAANLPDAAKSKTIARLYLLEPPARERLADLILGLSSSNLLLGTIEEFVQQHASDQQHAAGGHQSSLLLTASA